MSLSPRAAARRRAPLLALLLVFAALAGVYSVATPVFEGPDEIWHFAFASRLADGAGLPVLSADNPNLLLRNAAHPPLYYLAVAGLIAPVDRQDFPAQFRFNLASPHITPGGVSDRPNLLIHTAHEDFPYRQTVLAVHLGRLVSIALGVLTLWGVYEGARRLAPGPDDSLALLAVALAAFVPQFVYGSATINNDALAAAAGAWMLVALMELMNTLGLRWAVAAGLILGVALLSKIGMVALLPLPAAALLLIVLRLLPGRLTAVGRGSSAAPGRLGSPDTPADLAIRREHNVIRVAAKAGLVLYGVAAVLAGWWYARNWLLYGDPLAWREWQALAGVGRAGVTPAQFLADLLGLFGTFWADFGMRADRAWLWACAALVLVAAAGLVLRWRRRDLPDLHREGLLLAGLWFGLLLASAVRYALVITDIHGRLLYPGLTVVALALALGLGGWGPRFGHWLSRGVVAGLLLVTTAVPFAMIRPAFARPTVAAGVLPTGATPRDVPYGELVTLAGFELKGTRVEPGQAVGLTTYWRLAPNTSSPADAHAVIALVRPDGTVIGRHEALLGSSVYPSSAWRPSDLIELESSVPVDAAADGPVVAAVWLGVRAASDALLPAPQGETVALGRISVSNGQPCAIAANAGQRFDEQIRLLGYQVDPGGVTLCWEAVRALDTDYTVFVHALDQAGNPVATGDGQPRGGQYPTSAWRPGEQVEDRHAFSVPPGARIQVGLYRLADGERLPLDGTGETALELEP